MLNKKNYILFIALVVLLIGVWAYTVPYQKYRILNNQNFFQDVDIAEVSKIKVTNAEGASSSVYQKDEIWLTEPNNWPTEEIVISAMLDKLLDLTVAEFEIISRQPEKKPIFQTDENGLLITLYNKKEEELKSFIIGKISSDYQSTYFSQPGDELTYGVKGIFINVFDLASWQDKTILNLNTDAIEYITLQYPEEIIKITNVPDSRGEIYWRTTEPYLQRLDKEKSLNIANAVAKLEAEGVPEQNLVDAGLVKPTMTIKITGQEINETVTIGAKQGKQYFVAEEKTGRIYLISENTYKNLAKKIVDLK